MTRAFVAVQPPPNVLDAIAERTAVVQMTPGRRTTRAAMAHHVAVPRRRRRPRGGRRRASARSRSVSAVLANCGSVAPPRSTPRSGRGSSCSGLQAGAEWLRRVGRGRRGADRPARMHASMPTRPVSFRTSRSADTRSRSDLRAGVRGDRSAIRSAPRGASTRSLLVESELRSDGARRTRFAPDSRVDSTRPVLESNACSL